MKVSKLILSFGTCALLGASIALAQTPPPLPPAPIVENNEAKTAFAEALLAKQAMDMPKAVKLYQTAYEKAQNTNDGGKIAIDAAKALGYYYLENQDLKRAESHFAAEAVIARKLYFQGAINAKPFTDAVKHWASASGLMMRSNESAALVFYAREIMARERAALSSQILNREAIFAADSIEGLKINVGSFCAIDYVPYLKTHASCNEEISAKTEALSLQARQIKADAPKPLTKEEREAKEKKKQDKE